MKLLLSLALVWAAVGVHAQQTRLNGVTHAPDERLLSEYWEGYHLAKPAAQPALLKQRAPRASEEAAVQRANAVFRSSSGKVMALVDGDEVVWSAFKEPATPATRLTGYSMGKTVTSMAVGKALCENKLAFDTRAGDLLPELKGTGYAEVTVRQLLTMRSGIPQVYETQAATATDDMALERGVRGLRTTALFAPPGKRKPMPTTAIAS